MPFQIVRDDIRSIPCDALVEAVPDRAGTMEAQIVPVPNDLIESFDEMGTIRVDEFSLTRANKRNQRYIIHTPIPCSERFLGDPEVIRRCYRNALQIVEDFGLNKVAFPLIGGEREGCPEEVVLQIASEEIIPYIREHEDTTILLVIRDKQSFRPNPRLLSGVANYIRYIKDLEQRVKQEMMPDAARAGAFPAVPAEATEAAGRKESSHPVSMPQAPAPAPAQKAPKASKTDDYSWSRRRKEAPPPQSNTGEERPGPVLPSASFQPDREVVLDESFSQMVLRKIDEKGFEKDSDCYCKANIDRRLFSRIRCDENYHPKKTTAVALAVALELPLDETNELLRKAGYSLSHSILFDLIVEYCILQRNYNIFEINELLFQYDQPLLGS
ncbi:MAG: macro domain-containing protein [Clostridia bacterium]